MKKPTKKCGTCRHLRPRTDGKPFWRNGFYKCLWEPPPIVWPDSVHAGAYNSPRQQSPGSYMQPSDGANCPCWEAKAKESPAT